MKATKKIGFISAYQQKTYIKVLIFVDGEIFTGMEKFACVIVVYSANKRIEINSYIDVSMKPYSSPVTLNF